MLADRITEKQRKEIMVFALNFLRSNADYDLIKDKLEKILDCENFLEINDCIEQLCNELN